MHQFQPVQTRTPLHWAYEGNNKIAANDIYWKHAPEITAAPKYTVFAKTVGWRSLLTLWQTIGSCVGTPQ